MRFYVVRMHPLTLLDICRRTTDYLAVFDDIFAFVYIGKREFVSRGDIVITEGYQKLSEGMEVI